MAQPSRTPSSHWLRIVRLVVVLGLVGYLIYSQQKQPPKEQQPPSDRPAAKVDVEEESAPEEIERSPPVLDAPVESPPAGTKTLRTRIENMTIRDQDDDVVFRGEVDLSETIDRIDRDERLDQFKNDGTTFENRERRLPQQPRGYYREWVHPTPDLSGPGPQRIVSGKEGEYWYTPDHYQSFIKLH